ncbi:MAG TPA: isochorismatase family cysteine hydrolase [Gryllotalpicola sp.]
MDRNRTAVLLVDMQKEGKYGIDGMDAAVAAMIPLVESARRNGVPVMYTRQISRADALGLPNREVLDEEGRPIYYRTGSDTLEVVDELAPHPGDIVVDKQRWSGFYATNLDLMLRSLGIRHLVVGGFTTDCCVMTTVFDAYARDYQVTLAKDACAATNAGSHQAAILMMANWVYDIEIADAPQLARKLDGAPYDAWTSTAPDQAPFTGETLASVFAGLDRAGADAR